MTILSVQHLRHGILRQQHIFSPEGTITGHRAFRAASTLHWAWARPARQFQDQQISVAST